MEISCDGKVDGRPDGWASDGDEYTFGWQDNRLTVDVLFCSFFCKSKIGRLCTLCKASIEFKATRNLPLCCCERQ